MRGNITEASNLEAGRTYRVYENGREVNRVTLEIIDGQTGYVAASRWDELDRIDLEAWVETFSVVPNDRISTKAVTPPAPEL
mgnify:CR=1 FL=1